MPSTNRLPNSKVLLTFDDGPDVVNTLLIIETLQKHSISAVFFVIGNRAEKHPEILQLMKNNGHTIGNHSYAHSNFFTMHSTKKILEEIQHSDRIIEEIIGETTHFFRPPIGYTNPRIARAVKRLNKKILGWQLRSYDSIYKVPKQLLKRVSMKVKGGDIILFHDNLPQTAAILDEFITKAKKDGIIFATANDIQQLIK